MPGFPVLQCLPGFAQTHVHWVNNAIHPSHPHLPPYPPTLNLTHPQGLFQWIYKSDLPENLQRFGGFEAKDTKSCHRRGSTCQRSSEWLLLIASCPSPCPHPSVQGVEEKMDLGTAYCNAHPEKGVRDLLAKLTSLFYASVSKTRARDLTSSVEDGQQCSEAEARHLGQMAPRDPGARCSFSPEFSGLSCTHFYTPHCNSAGLWLEREYYIHVEMGSLWCHWGSKCEVTFSISHSRDQGQGWDSYTHIFHFLCMMLLLQKSLPGKQSPLLVNPRVLS